jgi:hypothetical protein
MDIESQLLAVDFVQQRLSVLDVASAFTIRCVRNHAVITQPNKPSFLLVKYHHLEFTYECQRVHPLI